jgi:site-specific DNA-methyltransferase (adenine-specific)
MDCIEGMKLIPSNSIDLVVTSPPYDNLRDYEKDAWILDLPSIGKEISRILKDGGVCVMVIQDQTKNGRKSLTSFKTIINWCDNTELDLWECCIYYREATAGAWWNKRFKVNHEYIPIFIKGKKPQYFNKEHMKIPVNQEYKKINESKNFLGGRGTDGKQIKNYKEVILSDFKCCGTVMHYKNSARESGGAKTLKKQHPATFPDKLASDFIQAFTKEGMIVVDPLAGSGTVLRMAKILKRNYLGFEINNKYVENIIEPILKIDK